MACVCAWHSKDWQNGFRGSDCCLSRLVCVNLTLLDFILATGLKYDEAWWCFASLRSKGRNRSSCDVHVPYRSSKLTRVLQAPHTFSLSRSHFRTIYIELQSCLKSWRKIARDSQNMSKHFLHFLLCQDSIGGGKGPKHISLQLLMQPLRMAVLSLKWAVCTHTHTWWTLWGAKNCEYKR